MTKSKGHSIGPHEINATGFIPKWAPLSAFPAMLAEGSGAPEDAIKSDLCRAMAEQSISMRCRLTRKVGSLAPSNSVLHGTAFDLSKLQADDIDWELSRSNKPWKVLRAAHFSPGYWDVEDIELVVEEVLNCFHRERRKNNSLSEKDSRRSPVEVNSPRSRGPRPEKRERLIQRMMDRVDQGELTIDELRNMKQEELAVRFEAKRTLANIARNEAVSVIQSRQSPNSDN